MRFFLRYLRSRRYAVLIFLACGGILCASFALYRLPLRAVLYPLGLCALLGGIVLAADAVHTYRVERTIRRTRPVPEVLPCAALPEEAYRDAAVEAQKALNEAEARYHAELRDMLDYYTAWAHQVKTPIAAMKLSLDGEDSERSRRLGSELLRIEQYVEMALTFLRLEPEASDYVFRECALDEIVRSAARRFAGEFIQRRLRFVWEPTGKTVITDEKWLFFVHCQLLSNALKYTREGAVTVSMTDSATLCVADTGIGIAPEDLPRIFDKGYTGCNGRTDRSASGIGLYLCRRVCRNLKIDLRAESAVGEGTRIFLRFGRPAEEKA